MEFFCFVVVVVPTMVSKEPSEALPRAARRGARLEVALAVATSVRLRLLGVRGVVVVIAAAALVCLRERSAWVDDRSPPPPPPVTLTVVAPLYSMTLAPGVSGMLRK
jgi:hypothetical protein